MAYPSLKFTHYFSRLGGHTAGFLLLCRTGKRSVITGDLNPKIRRL
jgi:hypothetical protein